MSNDHEHPPLALSELFGLSPWSTVWQQAKLAVFGDADAPPSKWGLSTLRQYRPRLTLGLYAGKLPRPRHAVITNLFNYRQPPPHLGWSVRVTDVEDFRGGALTYDSHNATDFSISPGSLVVSPAPGRVVRISSEFHRGGLKVFIDHGSGLLTSANHLGRSLVQVGQVVARGEPIALSGYSGIDAIVGFPFAPPHIHFNTWLEGRYVDPFAKPGEVSLWRSANDPRPATGAALGEARFDDSEYDHEVVMELGRSLPRAELRAEFEAAPDMASKAATLVFFMGIYSWLFPDKPSVYRRSYAREPRLDLPLSHRHFDGAVFADQI